VSSTEGDMKRGQSLFVWAIAEGRSAAPNPAHPEEARRAVSKGD